MCHHQGEHTHVQPPQGRIRYRDHVSAAQRLEKQKGSPAGQEKHFVTASTVADRESPSPSSTGYLAETRLRGPAHAAAASERTSRTQLLATLVAAVDIEPEQVAAGLNHYRRLPAVRAPGPRRADVAQ